MSTHFHGVQEVVPPGLLVSVLAVMVHLQVVDTALYVYSHYTANVTIHNTAKP
jgi:hypothetical protein